MWLMAEVHSKVVPNGEARSIGSDGFLTAGVVAERMLQSTPPIPCGFLRRVSEESS